MQKFAVIVAAGSGTRMGTNTPKQFLHVFGKPILLHTLETFLAAYVELQIILVVNQQYRRDAESLIQTLKANSRIEVVDGGETRYHSVKNGLARVPDESIVFVHDAVRCLVSKQLLHVCYETALEKGNAIPAITATDSIRIETENGNEQLDRSKVKLIQTPQTFHSKILKDAFAAAYRDVFTDEASVLEFAGHAINLVEGEKTNLKITTPLDLIIAEQILQLRNTSASL